jgi:hypothetical protein
METEMPFKKLSEPRRIMIIELARELIGMNRIPRFRTLTRSETKTLDDLIDLWEYTNHYKSELFEDKQKKQIEHLALNCEMVLISRGAAANNIK